MSVPIRKLCIDDGGALLKSGITAPSFHALDREQTKPKRMGIQWRTPRREWLLTFEGGREKKVVVELLDCSDGYMNDLDARMVAEQISRVPLDLCLQGRIVANCHEFVVVGKSDTGTDRRRRPTYRLWWGSE